MTAALCQWLAWRLRLHDIGFLLIAGILAGPIFGILEPEKIMGPFFFPFVSLSVPMLWTIRPTSSISNMLRWEGIVIDPIGAGLAV